MRKIVGVGLVSALLLVSCQKKEEQTSQMQQQQPPQQEVSGSQELSRSEPAADAGAQNQQQVSQQPQQQRSDEPKVNTDQQPKQQEEKPKTQQVAVADGKSIFMSKGCGACHQENADAVGPSLKKIASVYAGDKAKLVSFLKGEAKPVVDPAKEAIMKPQLEITKKLSSQELEALADFIIKH